MKSIFLMDFRRAETPQTIACFHHMTINVREIADLLGAITSA